MTLDKIRKKLEKLDYVSAADACTTGPGTVSIRRTFCYDSDQAPRWFREYVDEHIAPRLPGIVVTVEE